MSTANESVKPKSAVQKSTAKTCVKPKITLPKPKARPSVKPTESLPKPTATVELKPTGHVPKPKASDDSKPGASMPTIVAEIRELQRQRVCNLKSRIMIGNRLTATVATTHGYNAGMEEGERTKRFKDAQLLIKSVLAERAVETEMCNGLSGLINATSTAADGFQSMVLGYEKQMEKLAKQLPVAKWANLPPQRGLGLKSLAIIIGEAGDLSNYANPGKLWRRMGCAPYESKGKMQMPSTWRSGRNGKLSSEEWEDAGYSPRRRSVMFLVGESLVKGNGAREATETAKAMLCGPYRQRYNVKKQEAIDRGDPEWTPVCATCKGTCKNKKGEPCKKCSGRGYMVMRPHLHGMLLASKLLLKELWIEWNEEWDYRYGS